MNYQSLDKFAYRNKISSNLGFKKVEKTFDFSLLNSTYSNFILEINYNYDLGGQTITLPENLVLDFKGGKFSNGTITGNSSKIIAPLDQIFDTNLTLNGSFEVTDIYPQWWGAIPDANYYEYNTAKNRFYKDEAKTILATNNTVAFQKALDFAYVNTRFLGVVKVTTGSFALDTVYLKYGVKIQGFGSSEKLGFIGSALCSYSGQDILRFEGQVVVGDSRRFWAGSVRNLLFFGNATVGTGYGLNFTQSDNTKVSLADTVILDDLIFRFNGSGGILMPQGGLPIFASNMKFLWNNGPGITLGATEPNYIQAVNFLNISGDGNNGGLFHFKGLDRNGNINIINMKSEERANSSDYPFGGDFQSNPIIIEDCVGTPINIVGATHISSRSTGVTFKKAGDLIKFVGTSTPIINWMSVSIRLAISGSGDPVDPDPVIIQGYDIPYTECNGIFKDGSWILTSGNLSLLAQAPTMNVSSLNTTSGFRLNIKSIVSATNTLFRVQADGTTVFTILKNGFATFINTVSAPFFNINTGYNFATLPTPAKGMVCYINDATAPSYGAVASGGGSVVAKVFYNGTNWIYN